MKLLYEQRRCAEGLLWMMTDIYLGKKLQKKRLKIKGLQNENI